MAFLCVSLRILSFIDGGIVQGLLAIYSYEVEGLNYYTVEQVDIPKNIGSTRESFPRTLWNSPPLVMDFPDFHFLTRATFS